MGDLVLRYNKVAFMGVPASGGSTVTYTRMHGFTSMSLSRSAQTYDRKYIDRKSNDVDTIGYSPSMSFGFDELRNDAVCTDLAAIIDNEKVGPDAVRSIVVVDFTKTAADGKYKAYERKWSVVPDSEGDGTDAYTYSGSFNSKSEIVWGTATIATPSGGDNETAETITFTADSGE